MNAKALLWIPVFYLLLLSGCRQSSHDSQMGVGSQFLTPRMAAEWEPAIGVIIAWPLAIPHKLVIELAKDSKLFTMVNDEAAIQDAEKWYAQWGIDPERVQFIIAPQGVDYWWLRDWGPHAVFDGGVMKLADGQYPNSTPYSGMDCDDELGFFFTEKDEETGAEIVVPTTLEDIAPYHIGKAMDFEMVELPFVFTGGNVLTDGRGTAFSTCIMVNENEYMGLERSEYFHKTETLLGIDDYHIISNFEMRGIQHVDCYMKMLDEERLFVTRPPEDHELYPIYENILENELSNLKNGFGRPYEILRLDTDRYEDEKLAAYANSLILNQTVYVPLFSIPQDSIALQQWRDAMPGYTIKGFEFVLEEEPALSDPVREKYSGKIGWSYGDALHCRTRAMWDPDMLYISADRIPRRDAKSDTYHIQVQIVDYSHQGLIENELKLHWRIHGEDTWTETILQKTAETDVYTSSIPGVHTGQTIEFYISAASHSGRQEMMPRVAPLGFYSFMEVK